MMRKIILSLVLVLCLGAAVAQNYNEPYRERSAQRRGPRARVEWGVLVGLNVPDYSTSDEWVDVKDKLGWQVGLATAVNFGAFAIEPQIIYVRQGMNLHADGLSYRVKTNSIDVPVLFSLRMLRPLRIYAGSVFTVMNDCKQKTGGDLVDFSRLRPTVSGAIGIGVAIMPRMVVDLRYNGQLRSKHNVVLPDGGVLDKMRMHSFAFNFIYSF